MEDDIVAKWKEEETFPTQDKLSLERGDKVSVHMYNVATMGALISKAGVSMTENPPIWTKLWYRSLRLPSSLA